ncbi:MAG: TetR/AcrR family transcriptional regulator [Pseudomonadota bacterium]
MKDARYHHGDLRAALLREAEAELSERGVEKFSLRGVAKRAGVSHAAPAHHFGDVAGLLTALAAEGSRRFLATQLKCEERATTPEERLLESGVGYVEFACANPALFRLMFGSRRADYGDEDLQAASEAAFDHLIDNVSAITGKRPEEDRATRLKISRAWSQAHGLADLLLSGSPRYVADLPPDERDAAIREIIRSTI